MDKVTEILDNVKERISNPFLFSFFLSWLVLNWKIPVALIWFDEKQISANGCKSIFDFIEFEIENKYWVTFWLPIICAIIYISFMPFLKELVDFINKTAIIFGQKQKTKFLKDELHLKINDLENKLKSINNSSLLNGSWNLTFYIKESQKGDYVENLINIEINILGRDFFIIENDSKKNKFHISEFYFNPLNNNLLLIMKISNYSANGSLKFLDKDAVCNLKLVNGYWNNLEGFHNSYKVEYKRT